MANVKRDGNYCLQGIKRSKYFPFKSGNLKNNATSGHMGNANTYVVRFSTTIAPYLDYLVEGTLPHDIPGAFGRKGMWIAPGNTTPTQFGVGGNYEGKFHPGSFKHKDFIEVKCIRTILDYYKRHYDCTITGDLYD